VHGEGTSIGSGVLGYTFRAMDATRAAEPARPVSLAANLLARSAPILELAAFAGILCLAATLRLPNLNAYTGKFDEGIRTAQLMLMSQGFRPVRDIFASQGPLSLDVFFPFWQAAGQSLGGARLAVVIYSLAAIVLSGLIARSIGGTLAGIVTAVMLAVSPTFLKNSRLALVEIPAMVPALASILALLYARQRGSTVAVAMAAVLLGVALMIKPMVMPVIAPFIVLLVMRRAPVRVILRDVLVAGFAGAVTLGLIALLFGPDRLFDQVVRYRQGSVAVEKWSFGENWRLIADELVNEQVGSFVLAGAGLLALARWRPAFAVAIIAWLGASFWLLITYVPLQIKHDAILIPPMCIAAGAGLGLIVCHTRVSRTRPFAIALAACAMVPLAVYLVGVPNISARNRQTINVAGEGRAELYEDETELVQALTGVNDFIISDDPFLSYGTDRLVPPLMVDTSYYRIRSGSLSPLDVIASANDYDVKLMFLFTDGLRELTRFADFVDDRYQVISTQERRNGKDRSIYLRKDADLTLARAWLERQLNSRTDVSFANQMRLNGYAVDRQEIRPGGSLDLTLAWEAIGPTSVDYRIVTILRGPDGQIVEQSERSLSGGGVGTSRWEPGRWLFRSTELDIRRARQPGDYTLAVGLYDSRARKLAPVTSGGSGEDSVIATLRMRP
jgi:hypothetical protein